MKTTFTLLFTLILSPVFAQDNFLDASSWTLGTGSVSGFGRNGSDAENVRELGLNPFGENAILWKALPDANSDADGGWNTSYFTIDPNKTYRFSVWIKKTGSNNGSTYFGTNSINSSGSHTTLLLNGTERSNAYFWIGDLPELDKWYLLVGYFHNSSYTGGNHPDGGIYDLATGLKLLSVTDFKFRADANRIRHRSYLYYDTNTSDRQFFWGPTVYEVNGQEPTIFEILNPTGSNGSNQTVWNLVDNDINYVAGNVGIGTDNPGIYQLAVNGKIRAMEVKVETANWPDYVFSDEYYLPKLEEIENYINSKGHLPNIPSALDVEKNGIEVGEMNRLLLEKIEQMMLYLIENRSEIEDIKNHLGIKNQQ